MRQTAQHLADIPALVAAIEVELVDATPKGGTSRGKPTSKPPMPLAPVDDMHLAWGVLTTWARDLSETWDYTPPRPYWTDVCGFLGRHVDRVEREHPAAEDFAAEVHDCWRKLRYHLGTETRAWLPLPGRWTCPDDGGLLLEHTGHWLIRCRECGRTWQGEAEYERLGLILGCELTVTVDQAAAIARVNRRTIHRWIETQSLPVTTDQLGKPRIDKRDLALIVVRKESI